MSAVERARQALARSPVCRDDWLDHRSILRDLLAEIDAGHWVDTRELVEVGGPDDVAVGLEVDSDDQWTVYQRQSWVGYPYEVAGGATAAEAVRAAREAADA